MAKWIVPVAAGLTLGILVVAMAGNPLAGSGGEGGAAPTSQPVRQAANPSTNRPVLPMASAAPNCSAERATAVDGRPVPRDPNETVKYPSSELVAACEKKAAGIRSEHGDKLKVVVHPPFVVAGDMSVARLESHAKYSVVRPAKAMWASHFEKKPDKVITTFLFAGATNYKRYAARDYPSGGVPYFGYYSPSSRTMVMNINTGGGTLVHELTHALIVYDFPGVPTWFNEGLASLHEQCNIGESGITGLTNWRLPGLHKAIAAGSLRPLAELVTKRDFYGRLQGVNYAQARYFVMYMQKKKLLRTFYRYFRDHAEGKGADVAAIEHVFGKKIGEIEPEFIAWVKTLKFRR